MQSWKKLFFFTGKCIEAGDIRHVRDAADAGRHDDMARAKGPSAAVASAKRRRPGSAGVVIGRLGQLMAGPEIQLHRFHVELEPVGELVLGDVDGPVRRKRHVYSYRTTSTEDTLNPPNNDLYDRY